MRPRPIFAGIGGTLNRGIHNGIIWTRWLGFYNDGFPASDVVDVMTSTATLYKTREAVLHLTGSLAFSTQAPVALYSC